MRSGIMERQLCKRTAILTGRLLGVAALAALVIPAPVLAAEYRPMRFDRLSLDEGLSQSAVMTIHQDSTGFMWFGTENGLNRYDGYTFRHYKQEHGNPNALASDFIHDIAEDSDGNLWIATDGGGVARWERTTDSFTSFKSRPDDLTSISSNAVENIFIDTDGALWIGTRESGLNRFEYETGVITHYRNDPADPRSLSNDEIQVIYADRSGQLWVGTNGGLNRLDRARGEFEIHRHNPDAADSLSDDRIRAIFEDRNGTLWVGTRAGGLNRFDRENGSFTRFLNDPEDDTTLSHNRVRAIFEDDEGRLWVGTAGGLNLMDRDSGRFVHYMHDSANPASLGDNYVMSLFQDGGGILWVGTRSGGLSKWNPRSWALGHHAADQLSNPVITSFAEDRSGTLWVSTFGGGLNAINRVTGTVTHFRHDPATPGGLSDDRTMAMLMDHEGMLWVGTMNGGLNRLDPNSGAVEVFTHDPANPRSLSADGVMSLFEDRRGNLWVGTFGGGINRFERATGSFTRVGYHPAQPGSLDNARVTCIAEDSTGAIWVGTDGGGLNLLDSRSGSFHEFRHNADNPTSLSADRVYSLHVDTTGTLWVGTAGGGLDKVVGSAASPNQIRFENLSQADGLANDVIYGIRPDNAGNLWLSTNYGLSRYHPGTGKVTNLHRSHGLQAEEFNFGAHYRGARGELFFGGSYGFNAFFPERLEVSTYAAPVVLTSFTKLNRPVDSDVPYSLLEDIELGYSDDVVTFEFSALDFAAPEQNRYAYMLTGFDADWVDLGNMRRVTYTNLDDGVYVFRVKAANSDGVWSESWLSVALRVEPAPWDTWWAYLMYALSVMLGLTAFWRAQQRKLERETEYSRRLEQDVRDRTVELADRNAELQSVNNQLLEASLTDPLTGLRNRRFVFEEVSKEIDLVRRQYSDVGIGKQPETSDLVFMMIDLDHFKPVNDNCGHAAGDQVLLQVRDCLLQTCRSSDFVIRWGGDEFLVIARQTDCGTAQRLAERIRSRIAQTVFALGNGQVARTTCSIGYVCYPFVRSHPNLLPWEQVLSLADSAMYRAKGIRNAWVGFRSTDITPESDDLFHAIQQTPEQMEEQGILAVHTSLDDAEEICADAAS